MKILLADDHVLFREALIQFIIALRAEWTIESVSNLDDAYRRLEKEVFDIVLLDLRMPGMNGLNGLSRVLETYPKQVTAILSGVAEEYDVEQAMKIGAKAYFPKTLSGNVLVKAIEMVISGQRFVPMDQTGLKILPSHYDDYSALKNEKSKAQKKIFNTLTNREKEVAHFLAKGLSNQEIADELKLKVTTAKLHVSAVCKKMGVKTRTQAAVMMHENNLYRPSEIHSSSD